VNETYTFQPPRRAGYLFHIIAITILITATVWGLWRAANSDIGLEFLLNLIPLLVSAPVVPLLAYRLYALRNGSYSLERDSFNIQWGLRSEIVPMNQVMWVRLATDMPTPLRLPWFRWHGAILGVRRLGDGTPVEFLAAQRNQILLVGTSERVFAVSPEDTNGFLQAYQHLTEMGSLSPPLPESIHPTFLLSRVWQSRPARYLALLGALSSLGLLIWVSLVIPTMNQVSLGFTQSGEPREVIPGIWLLMPALLNAFFYIVDFSLGLYFYRRDESQAMAYLLWGSGLFAGTLFWAGVYFILKSS
jgi:hypothetical protein